MEMGQSRNGSDDMTLCYESLNTSCQKFIYPQFVRVSLYIFFGSCVIITVCGNLLVIFSITQFKQLQTPTNYLVLSLAVTDLLLGGLVMPPSMIRTVETCWYFGTWFCKIHSSIDVMLCNASILNLTFIAVDRYCAICFPLHHHTIITPSVVAVMVFVTWTISATAAFTMVFTMELNLLESMNFIYNNIKCDGGCVVFNGGLSGCLFSLLSFYFPGIIILSIYLKIYCIAQQQAQKHHGKLERKTERKATKSLAIVVGVFFACWSPFFLSVIIDPFTGYSTPPVLFEIFGWSGYLNSTLNPMVYALFYSWFRKAFRLIVSGKVFWQDCRVTLHLG